MALISAIKNRMIVCGIALCLSFTISAQVGINTLNPRTTLEVGGDMETSEFVEIDIINHLNNEDDGTFLVQKNDNFIQSLDVLNPTSAALGYIQEYIITNMNRDWLKDFDTGIDSNDYVVIIISTFYDSEIVTGVVNNSSVPYATSFISNNTWHIVADYPSAASDPSVIGTWTIQTLIFSKDLSKQLGVIDIQMSDGSTGSASTPIIN